jgi:hypothetical protein
MIERIALIAFAVLVVIGCVLQVIIAFNMGLHH